MISGRRGIPYERSHERLLPPFEFGLRLAAHILLALALVAICLGVGAVGYHHWAHLDWVDSIFNASMILTGMGPVDPLRTKSAKLFASFYALFSGVIFITIMGVLLAPLLHRMMHKFHLEPDVNDDNSQ